MTEIIYLNGSLIAKNEASISPEDRGFNFADGIYEMGGPAGDALLAEVISYCIDPKETYFHQWQPDDMVLWDNWHMLHCAAGVAPDDTRLMQRTTIRSDYALGRNLDGTHSSLLKFDA